MTNKEMRLFHAILNEQERQNKIVIEVGNQNESLRLWNSVINLDSRHEDSAIKGQTKALRELELLHQQLKENQKLLERFRKQLFAELEIS